VADGAYAVDNSAAFRMSPEVPLIVPEVNGDQLLQLEKPTLIANPNCSTIQLVVMLKPLAKNFGLQSVRVASYQAVSGAGKAAQEELLAQTKAYFDGQRDFQSSQFAHPMVFNCVPQIGSIAADGFSSEERKIRLETRKILNLPRLQISATTVRVPVLNAHSEAVWLTLDQCPTREELLAALSGQPGLVVDPSLTGSDYPLPATASESDPVWVGRIRQDPDDPHAWLCWVVADNLRKGAALNGIQIAEGLPRLHNP
jgi:aspartate-semialdehyde dehydrogenase